ncbi:macrolide ABC transporter ATP-binding protein [Microlunatus endophyticus]|uniref:Macrolide ABC transporter ATP-binding protein n=1 Tax=Microlunatus endophyticus TaxID=1716077 RepID=A0A917SG96_9ACTN|nr:ABC transporter ATP-binding protein [Microlunatus endophyticus]GGL75446.1 macrolide ABC transporter ATP-binding protein [Microlunatus endophyticus]
MARHAEADIPVLILEKLSRIHGSGELTVHALRRINLAVRAGELIAVMGPSGSGKSTLLNLAGALDKPTSGRVLIEGEDVTSMRPSALAAVRRRKVGFVFQDFNLVPSLTAAENVSLPLELDGWSPRRTRQPVAEALDSVGLSGQVADRYPSELSGGQQQRIAIARSLVGPRRLVLADEPTGALDTETGDQIMAVLRERCDAGAAGLLVTHEPRHAGWADRVIFLRDGAVIDSAESAAVDERLMGGIG